MSKGKTKNEKVKKISHLTVINPTAAGIDVSDTEMMVAYPTNSEQLEDSRPPIPMKPGRAQKYDYEYRRNGTCNIFVAVEPKAGNHYIQVTDQRKR